MRKAISTFFIGAGIALLATLSFVSWSFAALFAWPLALAAIFAGGLLFSILSYAIPSFIRWFTKNTVESNVKEALKDNDPAKKKLKYWLSVANNGKKEYHQDLWRFQFQDGRSLTQYAVDESNQTLLLHKKQKRSARTNHYLHESQSITKGLLFSVYEAKKASSELLPLKWHHRILLWFIKIVGNSWKFDADLMTEENVFPLLKESIREHDESHAAPTIRKEDQVFPSGVTPRTFPPYEPLPSQLFDRAARIENRLFSKKEVVAAPQDSKIETKAIPPTTPAIPPHLQHWLGTISLQRQVDSRYQQEVKNMQQHQQRVNINSQHLLNRAMDVDVKGQLLHSIHFKNETANKWLQAYQRALIDYLQNPGGRQFKRLRLWESEKEAVLKYSYISKEALECLEKGGSCLDLRGEIDLNTLPLGFRSIRVGQQYTLDFSVEFRQEQLVKDKAARLLSDPYAEMLLSKQSATSLPAEIKSVDLQAITVASFLKTLEKQHIHLQPKYKDFIDRLSSELSYADPVVNYDRGLPLSIPMNALVFNALEKIVVQSSGAPGAHFLSFLDKLIQFENTEVDCGSSSSGTLRKGVEISDYQARRKANLLHYFIRHYLVWTKTGLEFNRPVHLEWMTRLGELSPDEIAWFRVFSKEMAYNDTTPPHFEEISSGLFCFFDFLKDNDIQLQDKSFYANFDKGYLPLSQLRHLWDCLTLTPMKKLQWRYQWEMPETLAVAKAQLRSGYSFVHKAMNLDEAGDERDSDYGAGLDRHKFSKKFPNIANQFIITPEEFRNITYSSNKENDLQYGQSFYLGNDHKRYRALYLRFIAVNVHHDHVEKAIRFFEETTKTTLSTALDSGAVLGGPQEESAKLKEGLSPNWDKLRDYALSLPSKLQAGAAEKKSDLQAIDLAGNRLQMKFYEQTDIDVLLRKLKLEQKLEEHIRTSLTGINALAERYHQMTPTELQKNLTNIRQLSLIEQIALLRETCKRLSDAKKGNDKGEWLRLEQLVIILAALKTDTLNQAETGEGKTLILQMIAILKALRGEKVDVITHNKALVGQAIDDRLMMLAAYLKLKITKKTMGTQEDNPDNTEAEIQQSDIHYTDIATAVTSDILAQWNEEKIPSNDKRPRSALVDEADNVVIDIHANTTMQVSEPAEDVKDLEPFLLRLTTIVREELLFKAEQKDPAEQLNFIKKRLSEEIANNAFYQELLKDNSDAMGYTLRFWIKAAITSITLRKQEDYVVNEQNCIRIMHKKTTGERDEESQWSNGIHQCVAAYEKLTNPRVQIPPLSQVVAEGDVVSYLQNRYSSRCAFSGTLGEKAIQEKIAYLLKTKATVVMPRAKRPVPKDEQWQWPLTVTTAGNAPQPAAVSQRLNEQYSRVFRFPPCYTENTEKHYQKLVEAIQGAQDHQLSSLIFFNTIAECNDFKKYLEEKLILPLNQLQIFDCDTSDTSQDLRPPVKALIERAMKKCMVTLTTAAGSRGLDFEKVDVGVIAKPGLKRVLDQKGGRIGRNGAPGQVYEIYCDTDLAAEEIKIRSPATEFNFRERIGLFEKREQEKDVQLIENQQPVREKRRKAFTEHITFRRTLSTTEEKIKANRQWVRFFNKTHQEVTQPEVLQMPTP